jgi:hypothetical protein
VAPVWRSRILIGAAFVALASIAFWFECRQNEEQSDDTRAALRCVVGPPPLADRGAVAARYAELHRAALARNIRHPQVCASRFVTAGRYHGNASDPQLARKLQRIAELLERSPESPEIVDELAAVAAAIRYE